jgi:hypothetical protein
MKISICDVCEKLPESKMYPVRITRFEYGQTWLGKPEKEKEICQTCLNKIFSDN